MFSSLNLLHISNFAPLSCAENVCTQLEVKVLGSVDCGKHHFSSPVLGSVSQSFSIVILQLSAVLGDFCAHSCLCFPSGLPAELHSPIWIFYFPVNTCQGDVSDITKFEICVLFLGKVKPKRLLLLYARLAGWQSMCFILHFKTNIHFLMVIVFAARRKKIWCHTAKHIFWQWKFCCSISDSINIFPWEILKEVGTVEGFPCRGRGEVWMMCHLHVLLVPCAKSIPCLYSRGNRNEVFSPLSNVCKSENEQKGIQPSLFLLFFIIWKVEGPCKWFAWRIYFLKYL